MGCPNIEQAFFVIGTRDPEPFDWPTAKPRRRRCGTRSGIFRPCPAGSGPNSSRYRKPTPERLSAFPATDARGLRGPDREVITTT